MISTGSPSQISTNNISNIVTYPCYPPDRQGVLRIAVCGWPCGFALHHWRQSVRLLLTFKFMHLADAFIQSDLHSRYTFFESLCVFPGNWTHNTMLYHWAIGTPCWKRKQPIAINPHLIITFWDSLSGCSEILGDVVLLRPLPRLLTDTAVLT